MSDINKEQDKRKRELASMIDAISLGFMLIWIGIAIWLSMAAWGLIGAGLLILGDQAVRACLKVNVGGGWLFLGGLLLLAGLGKFEHGLPLGPAILIICGGWIVISRVWPKHKKSTDQQSDTNNDGASSRA